MKKAFTITKDNSMKLKNCALIGMFAVIAVIATSGAAFAPEPANNGICQLILKMKGIFQTLRILAFVGAAFIVASLAWDFIAKQEAVLENLKKKGLPILVGFTLLFCIGIIISVVINSETIGCAKELIDPW